MTTGFAPNSTRADPAAARKVPSSVAEAAAADLAVVVEFSIYGPLVHVHPVLRGRRFLSQGTVLFVDGGSGANPNVHAGILSVLAVRPRGGQPPGIDD